MAITRRQREVYDFISRFVAEHGYSPSFDEIGTGLGLNSLATVHKHITNLEKKGLLTRDYNRSRSIDLLPPKGRLKQADRSGARHVAIFSEDEGTILKDSESGEQEELAPEAIVARVPPPATVSITL